MGAESDGIVPEHPCESTTDMECFLSVLLDLVGNSFTLKDKWLLNLRKERALICSVHPMIGFMKERPEFNIKQKSKSNAKSST